MNSLKTPLFLAFLLLPFCVWAQADTDNENLRIKRAQGEINLDAVLDEADWKAADVAGDFMQYFPADTTLATAQSEVRMTYDDDFVYVGAIMFNPRDKEYINDEAREPPESAAERAEFRGRDDYVTPSLRRDYRGEANDGITIVIDPFQDNTNAFQFGVNPFGVQREGLIANGGGSGRDLSLDWDNKWYTEAKMYEGYWVAEVAIPWKTLRFREGSTAWNINFYRIDSKYNERSTWAPIPRNFSIITLAFMKELIWDKPLKKPGANISVIPYVAGNYNHQFFDDEERISDPADINFSTGGDAKIAVTPGLNLDLTFNPDFSQVEVDRQVTNLDRFEIFFPERRQFFLENADLFADFGDFGLNPFFSRRIGIARDTSTGVNIQNSIPAGLRLSGKVNDNMRVGLLSMQGAQDLANGVPSNNFTVATMQHKVFARSNISAIFVNKQPFLNNANDFNGGLDQYNRTAGVDYNLASADGKWNGKFFYHRSFENDQPDNAYAASSELNYNSLRWRVRSTLQNVGENYNPEVGFVRRTGYTRGALSVDYRFWPDSKIFNNYSIGFDFDSFQMEEYGLTDWDANIVIRANFQNTANFSLRLRREYVFLFNEFDPSGTGGLELPEESDYAYNLIFANFNSDRRKLFSYDFNLRIGDYFNGTRFSLRGSLDYRFQPFGSVSLDFNYNRIRLPEPYNDADLYLIGPRFDFTFTRSVFWTTFIQYNSQIDNININSRLQWRFKPVSDIFLVYTDNYFPDHLTSKGRAIVLKATYWLNL